MSSEKMKRCPGCGAITVDGSTVCGLCGSDLWGIEEEQLDVAVSETEKSQDVSEKLLEHRESSTIRRRAIGKLVAGLVMVIVGAGFFVWGILVLEQRAGIWTGLVLVSIGSMMIGFVVLYVTTPSSYYTRRIRYLGR
jgi:Flp pilus assembly protein TadB